MIALLWGILAPFRKVLAWAGAAAVIIGGAFMAGRRDANKDDKIEDLTAVNEANEVRNEIDNRIATDRNSRQRLRDEWAE